MYKLDLHDPFVRFTLHSIAVTVALIFIVQFAVDIVVPGLGRPLFVPFGAAIFCGTLALLAERVRRRYARAILEPIAAIALFPGMAWVLLILLHVPYRTREADFIALIPQAFLLPSFFQFVRSRFESRPQPGITPG
jgi:hypothetical protein